MIRGKRTGAPLLLRVTVAIVAAVMLIVTAVVVPPAPAASAAETKTAIFGTVAATPRKDRIDIATRSGVITLKVDKNTTVLGRVGELELSLVDAGMTVAGYYVQGKKGPVARTLTFVNRTQIKIYEHVVGVVIDRDRKKITVRTFSGELVDINLADIDSSQTELGSLIATVVERNATTGELTSTALQTARETVDRLSKSIDYEISLAQRELLQIRMSETATAHMTRLHETLSKINAETQDKIRAAYTEYQAVYEATMKESAGESIAVRMWGTVLSVFASELHVESQSDGSRWDFGVTGSTAVELLDGSAGTIVDIVAGQLVEVEALPISPTDWPIASLIRQVPAGGLVTGPAPTPEPGDDTIGGTIIVVDEGSEGGGTVVVVVSDDGTESAAGLTDDTVVIVDGEELTVDDLEPGQEVEIILADDGFSAEEITAADQVEPTPIPGASTPSITSGQIEYTLIGTLRSIGETGVILDGVQLTLDNFSTTWDSSTIGQQVELQFYIDEQGKLVVTGTK